MAKRSKPRRQSRTKPVRDGAHAPFEKGCKPGPGRPKGTDPKILVREALAASNREGEKSFAKKAAEGIARKAARNADYAIRAFDYVSPRTTVLEGSVELGGALEDRVLDALSRITTDEGAKANGASPPAGNGATGDSLDDPAGSGNGSA